MTNVGTAEVTVKLALAQLVKDAAEASSLIQKQLKDVEVEIDLTIQDGKLQGVQANLNKIEKEANEAAGAIAKAGDAGDAGKAGGFIGALAQQAQAFQDNVSEAQNYTLALKNTSDQLNQAGAAVNAFTAQAQRAALEFDSARAKVATLTDDADAFAEASRNLSAELGYQASSTEILAGSYDVLSSGFSDVADVSEIMRVSVLGAQGGFSSVGTVADATTTILNAYGKSAGDAAKVVDILAQTQDKGKITIDQYASQVGRVASIAATAGVGLEELSAAVATATAKGVPAESSISGVRQAIVNLLKPTADAQKMLEQFGIKNASAALRSEGLIGILEKLREGGATSDQLAKIFSDVDALATVTPIAGENLDDFRANLDAMNNASGKAALSAEKVANSFQGQTTAALNQANEALVSLGNGVQKAIGPLIAALGFLITNFNKLPEPVKEAVGLAIALTGGLLTLAGALAGIAAVMPIVTATTTAATAAISGMGAAATAASIPILPLAVAVAGLVAAVKFLQFADANQQLETLEKTAEQSGNAAFALASRIKGVADAQKEGVALNAEQIKQQEALKKVAEFRLNQLKEELAAVQAMQPGNADQAAAQANLVKQYQTSISALEGQVGRLGDVKAATDAATAAQEAQAVTLDSVTAGYQEQQAQLEAANKLKQAEIQESVAQGFLTEEQGRQQNLEAERNYLQQKLNAARATATELQELLAATSDPAEQAKINQQLLQVESTIADARLQIAQKSAEERKRVEEEALKKVEEANRRAEAAIAKSRTDRTAAVREAQLAGVVSAEEAEAQIQDIQKDAISETIAQRQRELNEVRRLRQQGTLSAEEASNRELNLTQQIGDLNLQRLEQELQARQKIVDQIDQQIEREKAALELQESAANIGVRQGELAAVQAIDPTLSAEDQAKERERIERETEEELTRIRQQGIEQRIALVQGEAGQIEDLVAQGLLSEEQASDRRLDLQSELQSLTEERISNEIKLEQQAQDAAIKAAEEVKKKKLEAIDAELSAAQRAAEVRKGLNQIVANSLSAQSSILSAQNSLIQAQSGLTQQRLQFALEAAQASGNEVAAENARRRAIVEQLRAQERQSAVEAAQLNIKKAQLAVDTQSKRIEGEIALLEAKVAVAQAIAEGKSQAEIASLQQIVGLRQKQINAIGQQAALQEKALDIEAQATQTQQQQNTEGLREQLRREQADPTAAAGEGNARSRGAGYQMPSGGGTSGGSIASLIGTTPTFEQLRSPIAAINAAAPQLSSGAMPDLSSVIQAGNGQIVSSLEALKTEIVRLANSPRQLTVKAPDPVNQLGQVLGAVQQQAIAAKRS